MPSYIPFKTSLLVVLRQSLVLIAVFPHEMEELFVASHLEFFELLVGDIVIE